MLDVNSGAVHVVDDIVYDVIPYLEQDGETPASIRDSLAGKYPEEEIKAAMDECQELKESGLLFTEDRYRPAIEDFKKRPTVVKALCLHIAHDCNLACQYCFAEEGEYHGRRALMSFEVGDRQFRKPPEPGGRLLWRRATDELAGSKGSCPLRA